MFARHYPIDGRERLRATESEDWETAFATYLTDLACPLRQEGSRPEVLDWLLGLAVRLEYGEKVETFNKFNKDYVRNQRSVQQFENRNILHLLFICRSAAPKMISDNPLDNLDFSSSEFQAGVESLADRLKVTFLFILCDYSLSNPRFPSTPTTR